MAGLLAQNDIMGFLNSPQMQGIAQGLLAASGPSTQPISLGQALGQGMQYGNQMQEQQRAKQLQELELMLRLKQLEGQQGRRWERIDDPKLGTIQQDMTTGEIKQLRTPESIMEGDKKAKGKQNFEDSLANLAARYKGLKDGGGATTAGGDAVENSLRYMQNSRVGQLGGKIAGTENQSLRNAIAAEVPLLTQAIKEATGMSAQQMNSNVELQTFLKALGDPTNDYESNIEIIRNLSRKFGTGEVDAAYGQEAPQPKDDLSQLLNDPELKAAGITAEDLEEYLKGGK